MPRFILLAFLAFMLLNVSPVFAVAPPNVCGALDTENTTYTMTHDVTSDSTCFTVAANNVTLDCAGYAIYYANASAGYGVNVTSYNFTTIENCSIVQVNDSNTDGHGIYLYDNSNNNSIINTTILTNGGTSRGIHIYYSSNNSVTNTTISTSGGLAPGILLSLSSNNFITDTNISTYNNSAYGILLSSSSDNALTNSTVTASGDNSDGIHLASSPSNTLTNSTVTASGDSSYGILLDSSSDNNVTGSSFSSVYLGGSDGNNFTSNNVTGIQVQLYSSDNNTFVSNNLICTAYCLAVDSSSSNTFSSNNITGSNIGVSLGDGADYNNLTSNSITTDSIEAGVRVFSSDHNIFAGNNLSSTGGNGLEIYSSQNNTFYDNLINGTTPVFLSSAGANLWNTTNHIGTNIIGGQWIGGNFYATPAGEGNPFGTGFSHDCADEDGDGICDSNYTIDDSNIDYLPLAMPLTCGMSLDREDGTYIMTQDVNASGTCFTVAANNVTLDCQSYSITGSGAEGSFGIDNNASYSNITVKNCNISNFMVGIISGNVFISPPTPANYTTILNNTVTNNSFLGVLLVGTNGNITNNIVNSNGLVDGGIAGIAVAAGSQNTITNNTANNNSIYGIYLLNSSNNTLTGNTADNNSYGILLESSSNSTLTNNTITSVNGFGISLSSSSGSTIRNNILASTDGYGITLSDGSDSNTISDNSISASGTNIPLNAIAGIYIESGSDSNNFTGNNVTVTDGFGAFITDSSISNSFARNNITATGSNVAGFYLESSSDGNAFTNNTVTSAYSVFIASSSSNTFTGNNVTGGDAGVYLESSADSNTFSHNTITGDYGIYAQFGSNATFIDNNMTGDGISAYLYFFDNSTFSGNNLTSDSNYGVRMDYSDYGNFTDNRIETNAGSSAPSIYITSSTNNYFSSNYFTNTGADGTGIRIGAFAGTFHVRQLTNEGWEEAYKHRFGVQYSTENFSIGAINGSVRLRIVQKDVPFGDVDQIKLEACGEVLAPEYARYIDTNGSVLDDITSIDSNVAIAHEKEIEVSWGVPGSCEQKAVVSLTANEYVAGLPFSFNGNYSIGSNPGSITADGAIGEVDGTAPSYSPYWVPSSGHPSGYAYVYIRDDSQNVYFSLDVTGDNTDEQDQDWTELIIGGKTFRIDDSNDTWGRCGFGLTSKVGYKHQTCEFSIPKSDIGDGDFGFVLRYYGTYSILPSIDNSFFNNVINATYPVSVSDPSYTNSWNTTLTFGTNIVGKPWIGGNVYVDSFDTGFSQSNSTCTDVNGDWVCDSTNNTFDSGNIDYLPMYSPVQTFSPIATNASDEYSNENDGGDFCVGASDGDGWCAASIMKRSTFICADEATAHAFVNENDGYVDEEQYSDNWVSAEFANVTANSISVWETNGVAEWGGFVTRIDAYDPDGNVTNVWIRNGTVYDTAVCSCSDDVCDQVPLTVTFDPMPIQYVVAYVDIDNTDTYEETDFISVSLNPPTITAINATTSGSTVTLNVATDGAAECRYGNASSVIFGDMAAMSGTNSTSHDASIIFSASASGAYYVLCRGPEGTLMVSPNSTAFNVTISGGVPYSSSTLCTPSWSCTAFSACSATGVQMRTCTDSNSCGTSSGKPSETQSCVYILPCIESWGCTDYGACSVSGQRTRVCTDTHSCGTSNNRPSETQTCTYVELPPTKPAPKINVIGGETIVTIPPVNAGETETLTMPSQTTADTGVTSIVLYASNALINATLTIKAVEAPQNVTAPNDTVIVYLNITAENVNGKIDRAVINFQVGKSKVSNVSNVRLAHYVNGEWVTLPTTYVGETSTDYKFQAETTGFSTFAVVEQAAPVTKPSEQPPVISPPTQQPTAGGPNFGLIALVVLILAAVAYWWYGAQNPLAKKR